MVLPETFYPKWNRYQPAVLYLEIILRIPVAVEYDDGVGGGEVDPQAARPRGQQKAKVLRAWGVEVINRVLAQVPLDPAVQPLEREPPEF